MLGKLHGMHFRGSLVLTAVMVLSLGSMACGGSSKAGNGPNGTPKQTGVGNTGGDKAGSSDANVPLGPVGFATKTPAACMLHQEAGGHYECLSGADGQCFHYGAVCQPADSCTVELSTGTYKECKKFTEGACEVFAGSCKPKSKCLYDPGQRRYRNCSVPKTGGCSTFGATCNPS